MHALAFEARLLLHLAEILQRDGEALDDLDAEFAVREFAAAELQQDGDLVALGHELAGVAHLDVEVALAGERLEADLLGLGLVRVGLGQAVLLLQFEEVLAVVHDAADRRLGVGGNLDQIVAGGDGAAAPFLDRHDSELFALLVDQAHLRGPDLLVHAGAIRVFGRGDGKAAAAASDQTEFSRMGRKSAGWGGRGKVAVAPSDGLGGCRFCRVADKPGMLPYAPATVAEALLALLDAAAAQRGCATLAIPGGRSPGPVLTHLARICDPFVRDRLTLLWLDERAVPPGHAERNDAATLAAWDAGGARPARVLAMPAERDDLEAAAASYAADLLSATGDGVLDACLIGLGEDGHLASLFPRHPGLGELSDCFVVRDSPKPPPCRLTLSLPVVVRARTRVVLCLGATKAWTLAAWRRGPDPACPASLLPRAGTLWYLDDAAAAAG